jgi:hypothetical protein
MRSGIFEWAAARACGSALADGCSARLRVPAQAGPGPSSGTPNKLARPRPSLPRWNLPAYPSKVLYWALETV